MKKLQDIIKSWMALLDKKSVRERALILGTVLVVLLLVWDQVLVASLQKRKLSLNNQVQQTQQEIDDLNRETEGVLARFKEDPDQANRIQAENLRHEISAIETELQAQMDELISPQEMPRVLEDLLKRQKGVRLTRLENLPAVPLLKLSDDQDSKTGVNCPFPGEANIYRHSLCLELEGNYLSLLAYLRELERLPQRFLWKDLDIEVGDHPTAKVRLTVQTLSLQNCLIGV